MLSPSLHTSETNDGKVVVGSGRPSNASLESRMIMSDGPSSGELGEGE